MELRKLTLGIDLGTNGCKASVLSSSGSVVGSAFREYQTYFPEPGWAEQNPKEWYEVAVATAKEALSEAHAQRWYRLRTQSGRARAASDSDSVVP